MNSLLSVRLTNCRYSRLILYIAVVLLAVGLCCVYLWAKRQPEITWLKDGNWLRDLYAVDSPDDLQSAFTIMNLSFMNGRLSAFCAFKNVDREHGVVLQVSSDSEGSLWSSATLQAGDDSSGPWKHVGVAGYSRSAESRVLRPGDAIAFNVDLDDYRAVLHKYRYGRIVTVNGQAATFAFDLLRPPPMDIPTREEMRQEREREIVLTPEG